MQSTMNPQAAVADPFAADGRSPAHSSQHERARDSHPNPGSEPSPRTDAHDAGELENGTAGATQALLRHAKAKVSAAAQTGKAYAQGAVDAAGKKMDAMKGHAADLQQQGRQFATNEPMKAVAFAAAGSALLTAVLLTLMRPRR